MNCVGIIGSGVMATGIAQVCIQSSHHLNVVARDAEKLNNLKVHVKSKIERLVNKKRIDPEILDSFEERINCSIDYSILSSSEVIIECVTEDFEVKKKIYSEASSYVSGCRVFATNTSSLSIDGLALETTFPEKFIGLHFFNPAELMKAVEIVSGKYVSEEAVEFAQSFTEGLKKEAVVLTDSPGFVVNRLLIPMINEAIGLLDSKIAGAESIDRAMKLGAGFPMGPLALADVIGLDVCLSIMENIYKETGDDKYKPQRKLIEMVSDGMMGKKTGVGFYLY